jgi:hypothetical protein
MPYAPIGYASGGVQSHRKQRAPSWGPLSLKGVNRETAVIVRLHT